MRPLPRLLIPVALFLMLALATGCSQTDTTLEDSDTTSPESPTEISVSVESSEPGSWVPDKQGPWEGSLYLTTSADGSDFEGKTLILESAGVPNLLVRENGDLILIYQYFSYVDESMFDVIAYSVSKDQGTTWTEPASIVFDDLPEPNMASFKPMDPTLVETEDGDLRLYFTYHAKGTKQAALYSALADDIDESFAVETAPALTADEKLLDPAVVFFDGEWHHYTWNDSSDNNVHSISADGISFTRQDDINLPMDFLGQVILFDGGLRFYGTKPGGIVSAYSVDGYTWEMEETVLEGGADPAIQKLEDGTFLMIYTSMNFNQ